LETITVISTEINNLITETKTATLSQKDPSIKVERHLKMTTGITATEGIMTIEGVTAIEGVIAIERITATEGIIMTIEVVTAIEGITAIEEIMTEGIPAKNIMETEAMTTETMAKMLFRRKSS
jgi:hypothetical protein